MLPVLSGIVVVGSVVLELAVVVTSAPAYNKTIIIIILIITTLSLAPLPGAMSLLSMLKVTQMLKTGSLAC